MSVSVSAERHEYDAAVPGILELKTRAHFNPGRSEPVVSTGIMDSFGVPPKRECTAATPGLIARLPLSRPYWRNPGCLA